MKKKSEIKFYNALSRQIDIEANRILRENLKDITVKGVDPAQWCQDIMLTFCIPQERAAKFLKDNLGLEITLLPSPEITCSIVENL